MKIFTSTKEKQWFESEYATSENANTSLEFGEVSSNLWEGFGGCFNELEQIALLKLSEEKRGLVLDYLFKQNCGGLNLNFCRIPIGASDYAEKWYSHNETENDYSMENFSIERDKKYLLPLIHEALKRNPDIRFFASPWSPPSWMKYPKAYNFGTLVWSEENLNAYALYLLKFIKAYEKEGVHISQLHIQNEPVSSQKFPSCIWTGEQFSEFIGKYIGPLFDENGIDTKIWLGTINAAACDDTIYGYNNYANVVLHDELAYKYVEGVSFQWAGKYALPVTKKAFPEKKYIQSENECGDGTNTWEYAKYIFELFAHYIANGVCAYTYWNMVLSPKGKSTWGWEQNSMITIENNDVCYNYEYFVMKHFSSFVSLGAKQINLSGHFCGNAVAFKNPDESIVVIACNPTKSAKIFSLFGKTISIAADSINTIII